MGAGYFLGFIDKTKPKDMNSSCAAHCEIELLIQIWR